MRLLPIALPCLIVLLAGCDQVNQKLGIEDPAKKEARVEAEGKAVGAGCRQSGRAIEDCYALYDRLPKAAIFAGWRDMNDYMLANKLEEVEPLFEPGLGKRKNPAANGDEAKAEPETKAAEKPAEDKRSGTRR